MFEFNNVSFSYKDVKEQALVDLNFSIKKGSLTLITGSSGSGKSTLLKLMNGLIPRLYDGKLVGEILFENNSLQSLTQESISKNIGYVSQDPRGQFFTTNTTSELVFSMENFGFTKEHMDKRINELAELLDLSNILDKNIFSLSSGERQKISIGCSLSLNSKLIILDEPSSNLDFKATKKLADLLCDLKNKGLMGGAYLPWFISSIRLIDQVLFVKNRTVKTTTIQLLKTENNNALRKFDIFNSSIEVPYIEKVSADVLKVEEITYENILKDINFDVKVGDVIGLVGKNGVGKTTLLRILMKIIRPTKGKIIENKKNLSSPFLVMQEMDYQFFTESVRSELALGNEIVSKDQQEKILKKMELYKMKDQLPFDLSGGEKQRLLVSIASLSKTNLFLFDEPTSGLDYINMERIADLIKDLKEKGAVVIATHDPEFLYKTCNRIIYLKNGGIKKDIKLRVEDSTLIEQRG
ncbi:ABC transporter ATP-binding protein [Enterococcus faecium]|uniref:energy-coupling factor ABC transporter ATP-binding protein n=1 Tax=Enterococcus faecium TaxID=1352 RepID=UPI00220634A7|nr:energy-coupling factor ABC transporter ATP-binding protein [Enterococcus faecium]BDP89895.1 ABC transporter ATP-binding protein [Enterococcus faecium]